MTPVWRSQQAGTCGEAGAEGDSVSVGSAKAPSVRCSVFFEPHKRTSGQRFFSELHQTLRPVTVTLEEEPEVILFNVSAPLRELVRARRRGQRVVLRVDGLYMDRISPAFLDTLPTPLRTILGAGLSWPRLHDACAFIANLVNRNYATFVRILVAHLVVYQSEFSRTMHRRYFPRKRSLVITNGALERMPPPGSVVHETDGRIRLVTIHDAWRPSKRVHDVVAFVQWAREDRNVPLELTILGYEGDVPACVPSETLAIIDRATYIRALPRFGGFDDALRSVMWQSDMYLTFTFRDACPNAVVEAMSHGLPVVAAASGGVPEIVGEAGELIAVDDFATGRYSSHRYECDFPHIEYEEVLQAILAIAARPQEYRRRVRERWESQLNIAQVAVRYLAAMQAAW